MSDNNGTSPQAPKEKQEYKYNKKQRKEIEEAIERQRTRQEESGTCT